VAGMKPCRRALHGEKKPVLMVLCIDAFGFEAAGVLTDLRCAAGSAGVPVVHSLTRRSLGNACGAKHCLTALAVMSLDDGDGFSQRLLAEIMRRATDAYGGYLALMQEAAAASARAPASVALSPVPSPLSSPIPLPLPMATALPTLRSPAATFCELPQQPFDLPCSLTSALSALAL